MALVWLVVLRLAAVSYSPSFGDEVGGALLVRVGT